MAVYTAIDDPEAYFQTVLYTGNGGTQSITNTGDSDLQPNWIWTKVRSEAGSSRLVDTIRGIAKPLFSNGTDAEADETNYTAFDSDGFSLANESLNEDARTYVAWQWKAGDSNTSVSSSGSGNGAINACTHRANTTSGFSIVKYTGLNSEISNGQETKVTHGLGVKPDFLIIKNKDSISNWIVTRGTNNDDHTVLNTTDASSGSLFTGNQNNSDSTHFVVGNEGAVNANGDEFIAYCFEEKQGYSKFSSYIGNGTQADGTFIYTGMKPSFVMLKRTDSTGNWNIYDNKRGAETYNPVTYRSFANENNSDASSSVQSLTFLSNGFKLYSNNADQAASGGTYIYAAFAESPFVNSNGVPNNAR